MLIQCDKRKVVSSGMLRRVALVRTDVSEELRASSIIVTRTGELGTTLAAACVGCELQLALFRFHHRENLKSYK
jgi:hypothetical protein